MDFLLFLTIIGASALAFRFYLEARRGVEVFHKFDDGKAVVGVILYNSFFGKLLIRGNFKAFTVGKYVIVKGATLSARGVIHELRHALQWKEYGFFPFLYHYLREHFKHGYACNRFEEDARRSAQEPSRCHS